MIKTNCRNCDKEFEIWPYMLRVGEGKYCSIKCKGLWQKSKNICPPSRKGLKNWCYGRHNPYFAGANNPRWKGGVSKIHKTERNQAMNTLDYVIWRRSVFERDDYTCIQCGAKCGNGKKITLNADHIKPWAFFPELRFDLSNGRTLCIYCHRKTKTYRINQFSKREDFSTD